MTDQPARQADCDGRITGAGDAAPLDRAKVDRIRRAIAAGSYPLDPGATADAMIAADVAQRLTD